MWFQWAVLSMFLFGAQDTMTWWLTTKKKMGSGDLVTTSHGVGAIMLAIGSSIVGGGSPLKGIGELLEQHPLLTFVNFIGMWLGNIVFYEAYAAAPGVNGGAIVAIANLAIVVNTVLAIIFLSKPVTGVTVAGLSVGMLATLAAGDQARSRGSYTGTPQTAGRTARKRRPSRGTPRIRSRVRG